MSTSEPLLRVEDLQVAFRTAQGVVQAVRTVDFTVAPGECLAVVGESGSGKSVTARTLIGLPGPGARVQARRLTLDGEDLLGMSERRWREVRGGLIGFMPQDALSALDPLRKVGAEVAEGLRNHRAARRSDVRAGVVELLKLARIPEPDLRAQQYPHQLSGGLRQRAVLATALAAGPGLLVADEPTTALDVTVQARILDLLAARKADGVAILLVSHDLAVVGRLADRIAVMHDGAFVETGPTERILTEPEHPYTRRLLAAVPSAHAKGTRLSLEPPAPLAPPAPPAKAPPEVASGRVLEVTGLTKTYRGVGRRRRTAVEDVSFTLEAGETLGVLGESGSGKSTVARIVLGLLEPDAGSVSLHGRPWSALREPARRPLRHRIQFVQQDPLASFDPRYTVERIVAEGLRDGPGRRRDRITDLLELVGLDGALLDRRPAQLSGGQRQRVAIARALAPGPDVIVCDEPVSALDVSVQAQILDLFADLQRGLRVALLFISHDLGVIYHVSDRVIVMKDGRVVETGDAAEVFARPRHEHTRELLSALPELRNAGPAATTTPSPS
ncbi:dipeptide ABC transporter ATP-binding protein [Actinomadura decatromicini]|uniref:ABC transporter ATP-binding protein n=1 Tax=Actinomadura decatromicini TaxID=2604572 RepID=A0A5D3FVY5_9ACTN|nr:ABC transporter ATP-binding protein [Actinomadura decatromicini]TYK52471.1 ABC transporter ATP-binding protein [Actinomadura decatromicini]